LFTQLEASLRYLEIGVALQQDPVRLGSDLGARSPGRRQVVDPRLQLNVAPRLNAEQRK
jgi:hypothetical protein